MRGYPKGLRAGSDPRKPLISVDEHFEKIEYRSVPSVLYAIEVRTHDCSAHIDQDLQFFLYIRSFNVNVRSTVVVIDKYVIYSWILRNGR